MRTGLLMLALAILIGLGGLLSAQDRTRKPDFFLDVASRPVYLLPQEEGPQRMTASSDGVAVSGRIQRPLVAVTLGGLDPAAVFTWGEQFVYEVHVVNTGELPITIPWSPGDALRRSAVPAEQPRLRTGHLRIEIYSADGRDFLGTLLSQWLEGSQLVPGTLQPLLPAQSALLRVAGRWDADGGSTQRVLSQPHETVLIKVAFDLSEQGVVTRSLNGLPVTIVRPLGGLR